MVRRRDVASGALLALALVIALLTYGLWTVDHSSYRVEVQSADGATNSEFDAEWEYGELSPNSKTVVDVALDSGGVASVYGYHNLPPEFEELHTGEHSSWALLERGGEQYAVALWLPTQMNLAPFFLTPVGVAAVACLLVCASVTRGGGVGPATLFGASVGLFVAYLLARIVRVTAFVWPVSG